MPAAIDPVIKKQVIAQAQQMREAEFGPGDVSYLPPGHMHGTNNATMRAPVLKQTVI